MNTAERIIQMHNVMNVTQGGTQIEIFYS
jgi:hypothetical protein